MGDLGYLIYNDLLWYNDWRTFPIGADIEDHRKHRPTADALMGSNSAVWNREMVRERAQNFFEGRMSITQADIKMWVTKFFHKSMLDMDLTDEEAVEFETFKGSSTVMSTLPRWLVSATRWVFGVHTNRERRDMWIAKYEEAMDRDTRGIIPQLEGRDKRFLADLLLTAFTSAGGISVPSVIAICLGVLHGGSDHINSPVLPEDERHLTARNVEQFALEAVRRYPVVVGFPWWDPEVHFRTLLNLAMSLRDPRAWDEPLKFKLRPLTEYHERRGLGTKIGVAWAEQALGYNGLTPDSRGCPGQELSVVMITEFLHAYRAHQSEWSVTEMPDEGIQITEGPSKVNEFTISRGSGSTTVHVPEDPTPAPANQEEADAERMAHEFSGSR